jgi:Flp pilus assembly protein TadG
MNIQGQSMIEFTIIVPVLLLLVFGSFDLGMAMWKKMLLNQSVVAGVRVAATQETPNDDDVLTVIQSYADFVSEGNITINRSYTIIAADDAVELSIESEHSFLTSLLPWTSKLLSVRMSMLKENTG